MKTWIIYRYDPKTRKSHDLGRVRANNSPQAVLRGYEKFKVRTNAEQRYVGARPLVPPPPLPPIPEEDKAALRALNGLFRDALKGGAK